MPDPAAVAPPKLRCTLYYTALESDYPPGNSGAFRNRKGELLHRASAEFVKKAAIEGSAKLTDGRTLNVDGKVDGERRWRVVPHPFGLDAIGCPLVMLRSAAVDPAIVPLRSILRIPETAGIPLPDGSVHDGTWYAVDVGSGIKGDRIDLFVGAGKAAMASITSHGIGHLQALNASVRGRLTGCPS